jgi:hypothetical protein
LLLGNQSPRLIRVEFDGQQRRLILTEAHHISDVATILSGHHKQESPPIESRI